jgi:hypothetical protein
MEAVLKQIFYTSQVREVKNLRKPQVVGPTESNNLML